MLLATTLAKLKAFEMPDFLKICCKSLRTVGKIKRRIFLAKLSFHFGLIFPFYGYSFASCNRQPVARIQTFFPGMVGIYICTLYIYETEKVGIVLTTMTIQTKLRHYQVSELPPWGAGASWWRTGRHRPPLSGWKACGSWRHAWAQVCRKTFR